MSTRRVSEIWTYPVKSLGGIRLTSSRVFKKGLELDRRWMLIDEQGKFMTQRIHHKMALFRTTWSNGILSITHGTDSIDIPAITPGPELKAKIWDDVVSVIDTGQQISAWFSERLSMPCRLVAFPEKNDRAVDPRYKVGDDHVSLADGYPMLIIGQGSLDDLNGRMPSGVPMNRFRPNIVFTGGEPYEEDTWTRFRIGNNAFAAVKPCARCVLPTVDQTTGIMGKEPLATLSKYRKREGKVYFGMNLIPLEYKEIHEGDEIVF